MPQSERQHYYAYNSGSSGLFINFIIGASCVIESGEPVDIVCGQLSVNGSITYMYVVNEHVICDDRRPLC